jgi:hypothetical protein
MLQDAKGLRNDVTIINIDFLLLDTYRAKVFKMLEIKPLDFTLTDNYENNWKIVLSHFLTFYNNKRSLYLAMTVSPDLYKDFLQKMTISGLAFKFIGKPDDNTALNLHLIEDSFLLDYLRYPVLYEPNQINVNKLNQNYLKSFKIAFDYYRSKERSDKADAIKKLALIIAKDSRDIETIEKVENDFH